VFGLRTASDLFLFYGELGVGIVRMIKHLTIEYRAWVFTQSYFGHGKTGSYRQSRNASGGGGKSCGKLPNDIKSNSVEQS
jgi:hypothetical protein